MKPLFKFVLTVFLLLFSYLTWADPQDYVKTIKKDFDNVSPAGTTYLSNKYGKIDVKTWPQNQVSVTVRITARTNSKNDAEDVFQRVKINFSSGTDFVKAETELESQSWWDSRWESDCDYSIDYEVFMPASNRIDLKNKYGNSYIASLTGAARLDVSYGNFRIEKNPTGVNVTLAYGKGTIVGGSDVTSSLSYAELHIEDVVDLNLTSKYSDIFIAKALDIKATSRYDDFDIGTAREITADMQYGGLKVAQVDNITASSRYTGFTVVRLVNNANIDMSYGGLTISNISKGFTGINLKGSYSDVLLDVEEGAGYRIDARTSYANINYPTGTKASTDNNQGTTHEFKGIVGSNSNPSGAITANLSYGGLIIK